MAEPIFQLTKEETDDLTERWGRAGEARKYHGLESKEFKFAFDFYKERMVQLGIKYGYNPDDVVISVLGAVHLKPMIGSPSKT